jgi:AraC family transcriptional regulator of adaptative response / DNA-3-methyladenine glycosylase II
VTTTTRLDDDARYRAVRARDARFDGLFFTAVRTTGIFCRPVCPARTPARPNVEFFPSAAAARAAGYRPCLRCRPEVAPDRPLAQGTSATVRRALRLIEDGALDASSVDALAERLGVTGRHLRRLFEEHLGAGPHAVASTRRALFAKALVTDTSLPLTEIAFAAGFTSLRRFNQAMLDTYGRPPRELRRRVDAAGAGSGVTLRFAYRPPFAFASLLGFLGARAIPGLERVEGARYVRELDGGRVAIEDDPSRGSLVARIELAGTRGLRDAAESVRAVFDVRANLREIEAHLARSARLAPLARRCRGVRVPGAWDGFELAVRAILGQQVTVKGATTIAGRLVARFGPPRAEVLADADLSAIGLTRARAETIRALARAVCDGRVSLERGAPTDALEAAFAAIPGLGPWTAGYVAMRALGDPDAFPTGDLALVRAAGAPSARALGELAEAWRPWRAYAAMWLWESLRQEAS